MSVPCAMSIKCLALNNYVWCIKYHCFYSISTNYQSDTCVTPSGMTGVGKCMGKTQNLP